MQMISSEAGTRLAKAKAERDKLELESALGGDCWPELRDARHEFRWSSEAVADELVGQGFADMEGS